jgi:4-hydroxybenzoate polyprenyltransferase
MKNKLINILKLMRLSQYTKNLFLFLPIFFSGEIINIELFKYTTVAFIGFSLSASAIYILNDSLDKEDDQMHPIKKFRPLASGLISLKEAFTIMSILLVTGSTIMAFQSIYAFILLFIYIALNFLYSFRLKHIPIIDITIISVGFVLRIFIGAIVTDTPLSKWIVIMTFLLALFLALAKRRDDVIHFIKTGKKMRKVIDGYNLQLIDGSMVIMSSVIIVTYLLYTTSVEVVQRFDNENLYLTSLFVLLGMLRYMQISFVKNKGGSPTKILLSDVFLISIISAWLISFLYLIY